MTAREKLIELLRKAKSSMWGQSGLSCELARNSYIAEYLLANGVVISKMETTTQRWIPVTERLPEEGGRYLCYVKSFAFKGAFYTTILHYDKYGFVEGNIYTDDVTHWMPLPPDPEEE